MSVCFNSSETARAVFPKLFEVGAHLKFFKICEHTTHQILQNVKKPKKKELQLGDMYVPLFIVYFVLMRSIILMCFSNFFDVGAYVG